MLTAIGTLKMVYMRHKANVAYPLDPAQASLPITLPSGEKTAEADRDLAG